ncbi:MAG: hypothetical protein GF409_03900 [Candidatus Omnitrophica bacterium]|nr:hypothetical protein [Candidatus Omnitrophota bacterium]
MNFLDRSIKDKIQGTLDRLIFIFFAALVFFLPISNSGIEISFGCILGGMLIKAFLKPPPLGEVKRFLTDRINLAVLIFYLCLALSLFASGPLVGKSLRALITKWGEGVLLFYLARIFLRKEHLRPLIYVFLGSAFLVCIDGIYQKIFGVDFLRGFPIKPVGGRMPLRATFSYHPDFATYLVVAFFVNMGMFFSERRKLLKVFCALLALLMIINVAFTYSRGGWVSFLAVCLMLGLFIPERRARSVLLIMGALFLAGLLFTPALRQRFIFIIQKGGDAGRFRIWKVALSMFESSPVIGTGLGLFMDNFPKYSDSSAQYAHNCYLQILAETGLLGLGSFIWMVWNFLAKGFEELRTRINMIQLGLFGAFSAFLIHAFFDTQLFSLKLSILFWVLAFLLVISTASGEQKGWMK